LFLYFSKKGNLGVVGVVGVLGSPDAWNEAGRGSLTGNGMDECGPMTVTSLSRADKCGGGAGVNSELEACNEDGETGEREEVELGDVEKSCADISRAEEE
jgi:hypothetical protein